MLILLSSVWESSTYASLCATAFYQPPTILDANRLPTCYKKVCQRGGNIPHSLILYVAPALLVYIPAAVILRMGKNSDESLDFDYMWYYVGGCYLAGGLLYILLAISYYKVRSRV